MMTGIRAEAEPLSRTEAVRLALKRNPEVIAALKEWDVARAQVWQARALPDPELELEYEELPGVFGLGKFGERNIGVVQTIEFPATWWLRNRAAVQNAHATQMQAVGLCGGIVCAVSRSDSDSFRTLLYRCTCGAKDTIIHTVTIAVMTIIKERAHIHECDCYHEKMIVCRGIGPNSVDSERFLVLVSKVLTEENRA